MLIIFDLDDTLIQTSQLITPWKFKKIIDQLPLKAFHEGRDHFFSKLLDSHQTFPTSSEALIDGLRNLNIDAKLLSDCLSELSRFDEEIPVELFPGVMDLLCDLKGKFRLALVTSGDLKTQTLKINKAGLTSEIFEFIDIAEDLDKHEYYKKYLSYSSKDSIFVVGDRIRRDLAPAKKLGFKTILVRQGRGRYQNKDLHLVDFIIEDVTEVQDLLKSIANT